MQDNFRRYGLLDEQVRFLQGWFRDTLPVAPIERLAVLRLDGDLYESTIQALESLYDKLSAGGYVIVDDYGNVAACRQAVHDFRAQRGINDPIQPIDWGEFTGGAHSWIKPTRVVPDPDAAGTCPYQANDIPRIPRPRNLTNR